METRRFTFFLGGFLFIAAKQNPAGNPSPGLLCKTCATGIDQSADLFEWSDYL